ncbi:MAG: bifunctional riboflavin kinase/FAD synthetase [Prevotellaceae bacterium]|jgi:riboflavin kinase/FMN adenylyltransferase|nr:bifunctional riboflavin kinase/FAD synthetase [Prevotellaceae bacterium]
MITLNYPEIPAEKQLVAATGFFDGVHTGHQTVLRNVAVEAKKQNKKSCVVTFWPHPRVVLGKDAETLRLLTTIDEKTEIISKLGINYFYLIPFTQKFSQLSPKQFFQNILINKVDISQLYIGYNHHFGHNARAGFDEIKKIGKRFNVDVFKTEAISCENQKISSTSIRHLLETGDIENANAMLGYDYCIRGIVVRGNQIGRTLGFPTANIQPNAYKMIPRNGVYAVTVKIKNLEYKGMLNIGLRPTLNNTEKSVIEVNIFDFDEDIYDITISVKILKRIRDERFFASLELLKDQLKQDELTVRKIFDSSNIR